LLAKQQRIEADEATNPYERKIMQVTADPAFGYSQTFGASRNGQ
jgi:hypothetical protein